MWPAREVAAGPWHEDSDAGSFKRRFRLSAGAVTKLAAVAVRRLPAAFLRGIVRADRGGPHRPAHRETRRGNGSAGRPQGSPPAAMPPGPGRQHRPSRRGRPARRHWPGLRSRRSCRTPRRTRKPGNCGLPQGGSAAGRGTAAGRSKARAWSRPCLSRSSRSSGSPAGIPTHPTSSHCGIWCSPADGRSAGFRLAGSTSTAAATGAGRTGLLRASGAHRRLGTRRCRSAASGDGCPASRHGALPGGSRSPARPRDRGACTQRCRVSGRAGYQPRTSRCHCRQHSHQPRAAGGHTPAALALYPQGIRRCPRHRRLPAGRLAQRGARDGGEMLRRFPARGHRRQHGRRARQQHRGADLRHFGFNGGAHAVDGACSSSLIAVARACTALTTGDLDFALAGGVDIGLDPLTSSGRQGGALATYEMRIYDATPTGFLLGEGGGIVALMRAGTPTPAECPSTPTSPAGASPPQATAAQARMLDGLLLALRRAYERAEADPARVQLFEGHAAAPQQVTSPN